MAGSTTRRGGRQKGTPNKSTVARQQAMEAGRRALEQMASGDGGSLEDIRQALEQNKHSNAVDAAEGTMTESDALTSIAMKENIHFNTALEYLQHTYRDNRLPRGLRQDAAKAAIRYETPALSNIAVKQEVDANAEYKLADTREQIAEIVNTTLRAAGIPVTSKVTDVIDSELYDDGSDDVDA